MSLDHTLTVSASYRHFDLVADPHGESPVSVLADDLETIGIAQLLNGLGVWTARDGAVPVTVTVLSSAPTDDDFDRWDRVAEGSIELEHSLVVRGNTAPEEAVAIPTEPGTYRVRVHWSGLASVDEHGLRGDDRYHIALWQDEPLEWSEQLKGIHSPT